MPLNQQTLVSHLESLTSHRDVTLLTISVMNSLTEILNLEHIKLYKVIERNRQFFVSLSAWNEYGVMQYNEGTPAEELLELVSYHPDLAECIEKGKAFSKKHEGGGNVLYVPVLIDHQPVAIFSMHSHRRIYEQDIKVASSVIGVYRNYFSLLKDSQHDTLTELLNRKTFDYGLAALLSSIDRKETERQAAGAERRAINLETHWLAIIDIDFFKRINDQYGHLYGDEVLILMANLMRKEFRQSDRLYRFGGEEFIVLMRNVDFNGAYSKLERFRQAVSNYAFPQIEHVTVTIGFEQAHATDTSSMLLGKADEALYYGKEHGRNQINYYGTLVEKSLLPPRQYNTDAELF